MFFILPSKATLAQMVPGAVYVPTDAHTFEIDREATLARVVVDTQRLLAERVRATRWQRALATCLYVLMACLAGASIGLVGFAMMLKLGLR